MAARPRWIPLAAAVGAPVAAYVLQRLLWTHIPPSPHFLFFPAVFAAAHVGGARAGYAATALSSAAIGYGFLPPERSFLIDTPADVLDLLIFAGVCAAASMTIGRLQDALRRERAAREATDMRWSIVAHDLRTPLTTIVFGSSMLAQRLRQAGGELERSARAIERSSMRARALLDETADAMSLEEGKLELSIGPCDVREMFTTVVEDVAGQALEAGLRVDVDVASRRSIACDEPRIVQVLVNLVTNAVRFTPRGGSISLVAEDDGDDVRITVRDTGRGIDPEDLPRIFERRWTKGSGGTGLGLWIARGVVEAHERELTVESRHGEGTAFSFTMPAAEA